MPVAPNTTTIIQRRGYAQQRARQVNTIQIQESVADLILMSNAGQEGKYVMAGEHTDKCQT